VRPPISIGFSRLVRITDGSTPHISASNVAHELRNYGSVDSATIATSRSHNSSHSNSPARQNLGMQSFKSVGVRFTSLRALESGFYDHLEPVGGILKTSALNWS
jgi:hypothetical protein